MITREFIIEKVVLAIMLLFVGASLTYFYECLDSKNDFRHEINKIRILKIGEVWEKYSEVEGAFNDLYAEIEKIRIWGNLDKVTEESIYKVDSVKKLKVIFDKRSSEFFGLLKRYKFYLGDTIYNNFFELLRGLYVVNLTQKADIWSRNRGENAQMDIDKAKAHFEKYKINIVHVRELFLSGVIP